MGQLVRSASLIHYKDSAVADQQRPRSLPASQLNLMSSNPTSGRSCTNAEHDLAFLGIAFREKWMFSHPKEAVPARSWLGRARETSVGGIGRRALRRRETKPALGTAIS